MINIEYGDNCFAYNQEIIKETKRSIYFNSFMYGYKYRYDKKANKLYDLTHKKCYDVWRVTTTTGYVSVCNN